MKPSPCQRDACPGARALRGLCVGCFHEWEAIRTRVYTEFLASPLVQRDGEEGQRAEPSPGDRVD